MSEGAIIDRMFGALAAGDVDAAMACFSMDVRIWHSFDCVEQERLAIREGFQALITNFPERAFVDARRQPIAGGFVQEHMMTARTMAGKIKAWPICMVIRIEGGLIARINEYIDRAGALELETLEAATPGL